MRSNFRFRARQMAVALGCLLALFSAASVAHAQQPIEIDAAPPELVGGPWLNTPKGAPIKLANRKGKVTILEFWTFG